MPEARKRIHDPLRAILEALVPHAARAFELGQARPLVHRSGVTADGALAAIVMPILVMEAITRLVSSNTAGRRVMDRRDPFRLEAAGRLALRERRDTDALRRAIRDCGGGRRAQAGLREGETDAPLVMAVTPFHAVPQGATAFERDLLGGARLCAVFASISGPDPVDARLLRDAFALTPREAEVCKALLTSQGPAAIAAAPGRSGKTVRDQVQAIQ